MADKTSLSERFTQTLKVLGMDNMSPPLAEYIERTFPPRQDWLASVKARLDRIFASDSSIDTTPASRERELGLIDSRNQSQEKPENKNKWDAVVNNNVWGGRSETVAQYLKDTPDKAEGIDPTEASKEIVATAESLGALTAPVAASVNGRVDDRELAQKIYKVAATNTEGAVTDTNAITAFDVKQESSPVEEKVETVRMSAAEEHLQALQKIVIATNGENLEILMQYGNALHAKVYQPSEETGYNAPDAETIGQYANAINLIKRYQEKEVAYTMQHA
jgi:hypothetical protein